MTDAQHAAFQTYLGVLAHRLILADWVIELWRDRADADCLACVQVMDVENYASISLRWPEFFAKPRDEQREILVHELLHLILDRPQRVMRQLAEQWDENSACQFAKIAHHKEIEIAIQRMARILAPMMPLPPRVKI